MKRSLLSLLPSLLCAFALIPAFPAAAQPVATPAPEWDSKFQRTNGWIGADGAFSIPLATNRTLWLFGDTFVGEIRGGRRTNAVMINNSIAIQLGTNVPEFFHRTDRQGRPASFFLPKSSRGYFWPFHGIRVGGELFVFLRQMENFKTGTPFGFRTVGFRLSRIKNPDDPPMRWKISEGKSPFEKCSTNEFTAFSTSILLHEGFIYCFGESSNPGRATKGMVVARAPEKKFGKPKQWRFWDGDEWQRDSGRCEVVCTNIASEFSVSWRPRLKKFVLVLTEGLWGKMVLETSPAPEGPWGNRVEIFQTPETKLIEGSFSYAGKGHPEFSGDDELLVTYAVNSWDFWSLFSDTRLYWPRFVRVKLTGEPPVGVPGR